jgi:signal transduction histidine kinase/FixJ family two-component response regulator/HPt (histidine-containing phosphotransfer) domain-containing protein
MSGKKITHYTLLAFIITTIVLGYVQYDSARNIDALITGNETLLEEFYITNELKTLEKDIFAIESKIRGVIATSNPKLAEGTEEKKKEIRMKMHRLYKSFDDDSSRVHLKSLNKLITRKLAWGDLLLKTFNEDSKKAAENLIATGKGVNMIDSISVTIKQIDATRQNYLKAAISSVDHTGQKAKRLNTLLILSLLAGAAIFLWYTMNTAKKQEQLIHELSVSERKVKESAQIKERFLANMSHEIRTPLNAILGFINLLQKKPLDPESADYVDTIRKSSENLLSIVNDILDLSKIESQMMRIESAPFSMRGLAHSVQNMFIPKSKEKNIQLITEIDASLPDILEGDATKLTQILVNLIGNAIKFTPGGKITVKITNEGTEGNTISTGITISDTGIGIDKDKLDHIFERFRQAEDSVNRHYGGTGLGLTIVNELVILQNGTIRVESQPGRGTTFIVMIPYLITADASNIIYEPGSSETLAAADFASIKLLVAEDNEINQKLIRHLFKNWKLDFDMAANGQEAVDALKKQHYDMVLMDIQMPEMDGYTAAQVIREDLKLDIPIIAMTAHAFAGEREKCISYGMNDYISKPIKKNNPPALLAGFAGLRKEAAKATENTATAKYAAFKYISLAYLKEISGGDAEYEKSITGVFTEQLPKELDALETAWKNNDQDSIKRLAHHLKTTISIMGLNDRLQANLDAVEYEDLTEAALKENLETILFIGREAVNEAKQFYSGF